MSKGGLRPSRSWSRELKTLLLIVVGALFVALIVCLVVPCGRVEQPKSFVLPTRAEVESLLASKWEQGIGMKNLTQHLRREFPHLPIRVVDWGGVNYVLVEVKEGEFAVQGTSLLAPPFNPSDDGVKSIYVVP